MTRLTLEFATAPDRENEVAEIWLGDELVAEMNRESEELVLEIYPSRDRMPWSLKVDELIACLEKARATLSEENR